VPASRVRPVSSATERPLESLWPPVVALRDTAILLAGLVLVVLLADGDLVLWLSAALVAIAAPFFALTRAGRVLHERRSA